jgi:hypothetical protein
MRPVTFRPHVSIGLASLKDRNDSVRLPLGISPREAAVEHFDIGPLHNFLRKGFE